MMNNEKDLRDVLWIGRVPIELSLSEDDLSDFVPPDSFFVLASRFSFLPVVAVEAIESFQNSTIDYSLDVWFEYNNIPLKRLVN
jgi:hypothetical protein